MWGLNRHITGPTGCSIKKIIIYPARGYREGEIWKKVGLAWCVTLPSKKRKIQLWFSVVWACVANLLKSLTSSSASGQGYFVERRMQNGIVLRGLENSAKFLSRLICILRTMPFCVLQNTSAEHQREYPQV